MDIQSTDVWVQTQQQSLEAKLQALWPGRHHLYFNITATGPELPRVQARSV